jgi:hypothetical protein
VTSRLPRSAAGSSRASALRPLLHPYLRWTDSNSRTFGGRRKVLAMLQQADQAPGEARSIELRDGQIYRWRA